LLNRCICAIGIITRSWQTLGRIFFKSHCQIVLVGLIAGLPLNLI